MLNVFVLGGFRQATDEDREYVEDVCLALAVCGLSHDRAAREMGITPQQWQSQRSGREHISAFRLLKLGPKFNAELATIRLQRIGYDVLPQGHLQELVEAVKSFFGAVSQKRGAA